MSGSGRFTDFGGQLKKIRLNANKTIDDVSGAVELSVDRLRQIEMGEVRPEEDLVCLLASYFKLSLPKTQHLLSLAGYKVRMTDGAKGLESIVKNFPGNKLRDPQQILVAISEMVDERAIYINETKVNVSSSGVVVEFLQSATINRDNRPKTISKIGMSVEHAYQLCDILQRALSKLDPPTERD